MAHPEKHGAAIGILDESGHTWWLPRLSNGYGDNLVVTMTTLLLFIGLFILHVTLCCLSDYSYCQAFYVCTWPVYVFDVSCVSSRILPVFFPPRTVVFFSYSIRGLPVFFPYSSLLGL